MIGLAALAEIGTISALHTLLVHQLLKRPTFDMTKLAAFAAKAPQVVKDLEAQADKLAPQLDTLAAKGKDVFARWQAHVNEQTKELADAENAINQLSNAAPPSNQGGTGQSGSTFPATSAPVANAPAKGA